MGLTMQHLSVWSGDIRMYLKGWILLGVQKVARGVGSSQVNNWVNNWQNVAK